MNKLHYLFVGLTTVLLTISCSKTKQLINKEQFQAEVDALEEHFYSEVLLSYDVDLVDNTDGVEEIKKIKGTLKYTNNKVGNESVWVPEKEDDPGDYYAGWFFSIRNQNVLDVLDYDETKVITKYYTSPLMVEIEIEPGTTVETSGQTTHERIVNEYKELCKFDKYGYFVKKQITVDLNSKTTRNGTIISETSNKGYVKLGMSYK